ncbi:LOB domain-containing protein 2-like isoform X2 [Magnolia sinica]|uniref:LOB domain-containing protein 2-like isoform X2 n=1 Tax=Magnolia sinica TaxID=86752 RepID=UPI00265B0A6A|nr:LOB domain-containing protein 2-like isoform X2 [Magnolia sinica]
MQSNSVSTHQACASCKHQRKRCETNCPLAPFFPSNDMDRFQAVHKVFGVSNTQKMIKNIESQHERHKAVESIIWEAQCREADPVNGCRGKYLELQHEMNMLMEKNKMLQNEINMIMENNKMLMENNNLLQNENSFLKSQYFSQFLHSNNNISISNADYIQQYEQGLIQAVHSTEDPLSTYQRLGGLIKQKEKRNSLAQLSQSQINQQQYVVAWANKFKRDECK